MENISRNRNCYFIFRVYMTATMTTKRATRRPHCYYCIDLMAINHPSPGGSHAFEMPKKFIKSELLRAIQLMSDWIMIVEFIFNAFHSQNGWRCWYVGGLHYLLRWLDTYRRRKWLTDKNRFRGRCQYFEQRRLLLAFSMVMLLLLIFLAQFSLRFLHA